MAVCWIFIFLFSSTELLAVLWMCLTLLVHQHPLSLPFIMFVLVTNCVLLLYRTNGHAHATVLHPSVVCLSSVTYVLCLNCASYQKTLKKQIGNGLWQIKWLHEWWCHMTLKGQGHDPSMLRPGDEMLFSNNHQLLDSRLWGNMVGYPSDGLASWGTVVIG